VLVGVARPRGRGRAAGGHSMLVGGMNESSPAAVAAVAVELDEVLVLIGRKGRVVAAVVVVVRAERRALFFGVFVVEYRSMESPLAWQRQQFKGWEKRQDGRNRCSDEKAKRERENEEEEKRETSLNRSEGVVLPRKHFLTTEHSPCFKDRQTTPRQHKQGPAGKTPKRPRLGFATHTLCSQGTQSSAVQPPPANSR
jgi:hypothetical protein